MSLLQFFLQMVPVFHNPAYFGQKQVFMLFTFFSWFVYFEVGLSDSLFFFQTPFSICSLLCVLTFALYLHESVVSIRHSFVCSCLLSAIISVVRFRSLIVFCSFILLSIFSRSINVLELTVRRVRCFLNFSNFCFLVR